MKQDGRITRETTVRPVISEGSHATPLATTPTALDTIFPFYLVLDRDLQIIHVGNGLHRLVPLFEAFKPTATPVPPPQ